MMGQFTKRTRPALERKNRRSRPRLEGLEDRKLLYATLGGTWVYGSRITYSFVPDGTSIGGVGSNLYATLDAKYPTATWKAAFQKAAAVWSSYANINLAQVSDNGAPLDTTGNQQNDSRFGDIRISMIPQNSGALAFAMLPPPFNGGPDAGDIVFNSNIDWKVNSNYDLQTVAIHEMGHALGLDHSTISSAVMYSYYSGLKQSLVGDDISGIQSVWGVSR
ncbi:MAG: matrixin family metalloprotease [Isosphaeraceae bacterium]